MKYFFKGFQVKTNLNYRLIPSIFFIIFFALFIKLGFWQLDRAKEKSRINADFLQRQIGPFLKWDNNFKNRSIDTLKWRRFSIEGSFDNKVFLLDNQIYQQKAGYLVFSPFLIKDSNDYILINRGWSMMNPSRSKIPDISNISKVQTVQGFVADAPQTGIILKDLKIEKINSNTYRIQKINYDDVKSITGKEVNKFVFNSESPIQDDNFIVIKAKPVLDIDKNYGYAFQWFAMAVTLLIIFLRLGLKKNEDTSKKQN